MQCGLSKWVETHDGVEACEGGADGETTEARLGDWAINDTLVAEAIK